jgi:hypothetical protein
MGFSWFFPGFPGGFPVLRCGFFRQELRVEVTHSDRITVAVIAPGTKN